jgi:hypothetical protein
MTRTCAAVGAGLLLALAVAGPAHAQADSVDAGDADQIVLHGELIVAEGDTVDSAVIFDGPARVEGTVAESLVVFNGRVEITGTVRKDVIVFNGDVVVRAGAQIGGDVVTQASPQIEKGADVTGDQRSIASATDWGDVGLAGRFAWWLAYSISTLILGLILLLAAPRLDAAVTWAGRERTGASIGIGLAVFVLLPIAGVLLLATIVGIPLGLFVLLGIALLYTVGYAAGTHAIGRRAIAHPKSRFVAFLVGWVIVRLLGLIPIVGGLVWTLVTIFGLGVLVTAARRPSPIESRSTGSPPPPVPVPVV